MKNVIEERVQKAINSVRSFIIADGGDIDLIKIEDFIVYVQFKGACVGCPLSLITLSLVVEEAVKEQVPEIKKVIKID